MAMHLFRWGRHWGPLIFALLVVLGSLLVEPGLWRKERGMAQMKKPLYQVAEADTLPAPVSP